MLIVDPPILLLELKLFPLLLFISLSAVASAGDVEIRLDDNMST